MALHAISPLTHRRPIDGIERHRADAQLIVLQPPCPLSVTPIDFDPRGRADRLRPCGRSGVHRERGRTATSDSAPHSQP
jgi:hypothetical protein